ncbi:MAG TPA: chorismate lyase, partial [Pasteurellaceae bacterium]|nr:chorismate lyase [Pasteurellaceae bacterium]
IKKIYQNEIEVLPDTQYWCREVVLYGDDIPWVAARTLISIPLLNDYQELLQLGNMPIGEWLFKQKLERQKMQWSLDKNTQRYARRSLFLIQQMPLLITELFLENSPITR